MFKDTYKNMNKKISPSEELINDTLTAANKLNKEKKGSRRYNLKFAVIAAVICLCILFGIPSIAANTPIAYDMLFTIAPKTAQFFKAVNMSCTDNGIEMRVIATHIYDNTAEIYIEMRDLEGDRIDETTDLFDSYDINRPFDGYGHCETVSYDEDRKAVTFLISVTETEVKKIRGKKMTFSVDRFLSHKNKTKMILNEIDFNNIERNPKMKKNAEIVGLSGKYMKEYEKYNFRGTEQISVLDTKNPLLSPVEGIDIMGIGYTDNRLHIQTRHQNVHQTDNHAFIQLTDRNGIEADCESSLTFWDSERKDHYYEYIYDIDYNELGNYTLSGEFTTCGTLTEGKWRVTFPLEASEE